ncbi:MAG: DNA methylase [Lachnospiraceae bacterium]|nr:DNA methylase [Lachnospiraceae bacterium]
MNKQRYYIAIDLKSFYASVECIDRNLDPLNINLVVADKSRTEKTICLAVSPSLKAFGIPGRPRLFEVNSTVKQINKKRHQKINGKEFTGSSCDYTELKKDPYLELDFMIAAPRMSRYMEISAKIYNIYLKYIAPEDIHVYSIDEVFMDITDYLDIYNLTPHELTMKIIREVMSATGITATAGIGTNLYLCKVAMDIVAKHVDADKDGVRIAELDEMSYRRLLWEHKPLTDFWRVGKGIANRLEKYSIFTMGDIAACSVGTDNDFFNEELLYGLFGVNAELLIDHAWGYEPCQIKDIKAYKPDSNSLSSGQVLMEPYTYEKARIIVWEMTDLLVLDLVRKRLVTDQLVLTVGYDIENIKNETISEKYKGEINIDHYGRAVPKSAHGTVNLESYSSSGLMINNAVLQLYDEIINKDLLIRRINVAANNLINEDVAFNDDKYEQLDLFTDYALAEKKNHKKEAALLKEKQIQHALIDIQEKYGKNSILKGTNYIEGAMTKERNSQIGGHRA